MKKELKRILRANREQLEASEKDLKSIFSIMFSAGDRTLCETNDGFRLAELDLKLRGAGDINGTMQSGAAFDLKIANPTLDTQILQVTQGVAIDLLTDDPALAKPENRGLAELKQRYSAEKKIDFSMIS